MVYVDILSEKDELMIRNAELSQRLKSLEVEKLSEEQQLIVQVKDKESQIESLEQEIKNKESQMDDLNERLGQSEGQVKELEGHRSKSVEESSTMSSLQQTVASLEEQLADKNKVTFFSPSKNSHNVLRLSSNNSQILYVFNMLP